MMDTMQTTDMTTNIPVIGIGARMKAAREALKMTEKEAAARLHLNVKFIYQMESENFSGETPVTFLRGYLRAYAKVLGISEQEIAEALDQLDIHAPAPKTLTSRVAVPAPRHHEKYSRWISYLVAGVLIILVLMWWSSHSKETSNQTKTTEETADSLAQPNAPDSLEVDSANTTPVAPTSLDGNKTKMMATPSEPPSVSTPSNQVAPSNNTNAVTNQEETLSHNQPIDEETLPADENNDTKANADTLEEEQPASNPPREAHLKSRTHMKMAVPEPGLDVSDS